VVGAERNGESDGGQEEEIARARVARLPGNSVLTNAFARTRLVCKAFLGLLGQMGARQEITLKKKLFMLF